MKRGKKGQFYLLAAIVIIAVIFGLTTVRNYAKTPNENTVVYDLKEELNLETGHVVDWTIYNKKNTSIVVENWKEIYVRSREDKEVENWIFVYGDKENITVLTFENITAGTVSLNLGASSSSIQITGDEKKKDTFKRQSDEISISLNDINYNFTLDKDKNFIFLIKKGGYIV